MKQETRGQALSTIQVSISGCKVKDFSNAGNLRRHQREVHSSPYFTRPVTNCKRHRKGFGRKDNLAQHLKRTNSEDAIESTLASSSITSGNGVVAASPNEKSLMVSVNGEPAIDEMEVVESKLLDKAWLLSYASCRL